MQTFRKIIKLLTPKERKTASLLMLMILIMALLDLIGVASIMPFMAVLMNPSIIETNALINYIFLYKPLNLLLSLFLLKGQHQLKKL